MRPCSVLLSGTLPLLLAAGQPPAAVPVPNAGFERGTAGWSLRTPGARLEASGEARSEGGAALRVTNPAGGAETTVQGEAVKLQVGHLYRLSAWIRAKGVKADAAARYPTPLGACVSMQSFPFTNQSPTVAADHEGRVSVLFYATAASDRVQLHLGRAGKAEGSAFFDDVRLEKVEDIREAIPLERVTWSGPGFRYEDSGWTFLHIEGAPFARGFQHGELMARELAVALEKLAISKDAKEPRRAWDRARTMCDALFLRKFDVEFLEEMKGIAEGAAKAGAKAWGRPVDLLDVVAMNSAIDLDYLESALHVTPNPLTGRSFAKAEDEAAVPANRSKCSSFIATKSATKNGRFIMGQMFMWAGYTGTDWKVVCDVVPTRGHRLVYQTFPGGIHSGADWYLNGAGLVIGETTVGQTPFQPEGTPQSNRIRKAAQYADSIDAFAALMKERNNGLYTNDWTVADARTDEGACLLLGTRATRLWRTGSKGHPADTPGDLKDFIWANNNNRDLEVRKEYVQTADAAPVDLAFNTWNRDIAFQEMYRGLGKEKLDLEGAVRVWASSPIQRPHACDGKLTTAEMAEQLMFIAHQGKTTHREKWVGGRYVPDLPHATPHLTHGYATFSPVFVAARLAEARRGAPKEAAAPAPGPLDTSRVKEMAAFDRKDLWTGTVFPASDAENWFSSGDAAYHGILKRLPEDPAKAFAAQSEALADLNARYRFLAQREVEEAPLKTRTAYDRYGAYQMPRIKGTFALHQLRLWLGNAAFSKVMAQVHARCAGKPAHTEELLKLASEAAGRDLRPLVLPWLERTGLPDPTLEARTSRTEQGHEVDVTVRQRGDAYPFVATVEIATAKGRTLERLEVKGSETRATFRVAEKPLRVTLNAGHEVPVASMPPATLPNLLDAWEKLLFVPGTSREVEANRSLATAFRDQVADTFTEVLPELRADAEVTEQELRERDLVLFGGIESNALLARMAREHALPVAFGDGFFRFQGRLYAAPDDGVAFAMPNPWNPRRTVYVFSANTRTQLWRMTRSYPRGLAGWALWKGAEVASKGFHESPGLTVTLE